MPRSRTVEIYLQSPTYLHGEVLNELNVAIILPFLPSELYISQFSNMSFLKAILKDIILAKKRKRLLVLNILFNSLPGNLISGVKRPGRDADRSPPSSAEVKNTCCTPSFALMGEHGSTIS
jgi:hypothetical protein